MSIDAVLVNQLCQFATAGRGLWIGLPADRSPKHELTKLQLDEANPGVLTLSDDAHVTIAHLGKKNDKREVDAAITACYVVSEILTTSAVDVECVARFPNHLVGILAPRLIDYVIDKVWKCLIDAHVHPDDSFAGVRHVTMAHVRRGTEMIHVPRLDRHTLIFSEIMVVCGKATMRFPLKTATTVF